MFRNCNFMARFNSFFLSVILWLFSAVAVAQKTFDVDGLRYTINSDRTTVTLSSYTRSLTGTLNIPSTVTKDGKEYTVTAIGTDAFLSGRTFLCTTIILPPTVKTIGVSAFKNRSSIRSVIFSEGLEVIGAGAFEGARYLDNITLPKSLKTIQAHAFKNCPSLCNVTVLAPPAILSSDGCKGGEATGRDHCDWFNSRNEDCQKLTPPQTCSHCSNPYLKVPIEYYEEYFKNAEWNYEFEHIQSDFNFTSCYHLQVADKIYDGTNEITTENIDFNQTCDYFSDGFLRDNIFKVASFTANGVEAGSGYKATVRLALQDKVSLTLNEDESVITGTYSILPKTLTFDGDVVVAPKTYDGTTDIDPSTITLPNLVGIVGDDDVRLVIEGTPQMESKDVNDDSKVNGGLNLIPSIKVRLVGAKAKNYVLETNEIKNALVKLNPRDLNVTCDNISVSPKVYDGKADFKKQYFTLPSEFGLLDGDRLTMEPVATAPSANVGEYSVQIGIYFTGDDQMKANYGVSGYSKKNPYLTCAKTLKITPKKITNIKYDISVANHTYDCSFDDKDDVTVSNVVFGKEELLDSDVELQVLSATLADKNVTGAQTSTTIVLTLTGNSSGNYQLELPNNGVEVKSTRVLPAKLTIVGRPTLTNHVYDGSTNCQSDVDITGVSLAGFSCDDKASASLISAVLSQKNASISCGQDGADSVSADVTVKFTGDDLSNYSIDGLSSDGTYTFKGLNTDIQPRTVSIDASKTSIDDKVYDGKKTIDPATVHYVASVNNAVSGDDIKAELADGVTMGTKTAGRNLVRFKSRLVGADAANYALRGCATEQTNLVNITVYKRKVDFTGLDLVVDSYPFTCGGVMDISASVKLPDPSEYLQYDEDGNPDDYHIEANDAVYYQEWNGTKYYARLTLKMWGNDQPNYEFIGSNQFNEEIELSPKEDVNIDYSSVAASISHVFDCGLDVTADYNGPTKIQVSGLCPIDGQQPDVYYEFKSATITDNPNVGEGHPTLLVFALAGSSLSNSKFDKSLYGLKDEIEITEGVTTRVTPASASADFSSLPEKLQHVYDGTNTFTTDELKKYSLSPIPLSTPCGNVAYELYDVSIDKSDAGPAVATLTYKIPNADSETLKNLGLSSDVVIKTIPTNITTRMLKISVSMPDCHVYDRKRDISFDELNIVVSNIATPGGVRDDVKVIFSKAQLDSPNVGTNRTLTVKMYLSGKKSSNYFLPNGGSLKLKNVEVCPAELEVKGAIEFNDHVYDCGVDAKNDVKSYPYVEIGTSTVNLKFDGDDYAIISTKDCGSRTVQCRLSLVGQPNYKLKGGVGASSNKAIFTDLPINVVPRHLSLSGLGSATPHTYDCSVIYNGTITTPKLSNVSCNEAVSLKVVSALFADGANTVGNQDITVTYALDGKSNVISNYVLDNPVQVVKAEVLPIPVSYTDPDFSKPVNHKYNCGNLTDVKADYLRLYPEVIAIQGVCENDNLFYKLFSVTITDADKTPDTGRETTVVYKLNNIASASLPNYTGLPTSLTYKIKTDISKPEPAAKDDPRFTTVYHKYVCGETGDVTDDYMRSSFATIPVSNICDNDVKYVVESAQILSADLTPAERLATRVVYSLQINSTNFDPEDYDLPLTLTYNSALTTITRPDRATYEDPTFRNVSHQYNCEGESGDVTTEFKANPKYNIIPVDGVCGADVYYELVKAQITEPVITPGKYRATEVFYKLVAPSGFDPSDFSLETSLKYATAYTDVTYPDPATFSKPSFKPVNHKYACGDNGDVTDDFKKSDYATITVYNVCHSTAKYVLRSATINGTDYKPSSDRATTVVYDLVLPEGYLASYYGLQETITYTDALTNITKPDSATVVAPVFTPVSHTYECNEDGDVTSEYRAAFGSLTVSGVCGLDVRYELESAKIIGTDYTPKDSRPTRVTYRLVMPSGDPDLFSLASVVTYDDALTNVLKPEIAKYQTPDFKVVDKTFVCDFNGDVTSEFKAAGYGSIPVTGVCGADVKYVLSTATVLGSDFTPENGMPTTLVYELSYPSNFDPSIFGLAKQLSFNVLTNIRKPAPAVVEAPVFTPVDHKYLCGETGDVTSEFKKSRFATVKVSDICGRNVYYQLRSALVTVADLTPADKLPTTVVYDLVMPDGYDADDFGLSAELVYDNALTNITKPDSASFSDPVFATVSHKYDCEDTGDVTDDYKAASFNRIAVSGVCGADVYYEIASAKISDKSRLTPAVGVKTTIIYSLHYPADFNPSDFGLRLSLTYYNALTDITVSDAASFAQPVFTAVDHQYVCDESGVVTADYKKIAELNKLAVTGVCRDDVFYEIESAEIIDKSDLTPAEGLFTKVTYRIHPSDFNYSDFGLSPTLTFGSALTNITKPEPASYKEPEFTAVRHQYVCGDSGDVTAEYQSSPFSTIAVSGVCGQSVTYRLTSAVISDADKTPGENRPTDVTYELVYPLSFDPEDFGLATSIVLHNALTTVTNPQPALFERPIFTAVDHQYQCPETGDVTTEYQASQFNRIEVDGVCGADVYYEVTSATIVNADLTPASALPTTVVYALRFPDGFVPDEFALTTSLQFDDALTNITKPEPATFEKPKFASVSHKYVCHDNGNVTAEYQESDYSSIAIRGVCGGEASYILVNAQIAGSDFTPADGLATTLLYKLQLPVGQDAKDYGLAETVSFDDALTNVLKPDPATFVAPTFTPIDHQYQCNDNGDVTLQYQASSFGSIYVDGVCGERVFYELYKAQIQGSDFTPACNLPTTVYYRLHAPANFDPTDFSLKDEIVFNNAITNVTKPVPAGYVEPKFEVVEHRFECEDDGDVTAEYLASGYRTIEVSGICDKYVCYRLESAQILASDFTPADGLPTRVVYQLDRPEGYNPQDYGLSLTLTFENAITNIVKPEKPVITNPVFTPVNHDFVCDADADVTSDYLNSPFNEIAVSDICGRKVYYKLTKAAILSGDLTPADSLQTRVEYELVMPDGFDREDFRLEQNLIFSNALTNILKPAPASFSRPAFTAVTHVYDCADRGDVTTEYQASDFNEIVVSDICGNKVSYKLASAIILGDDFSPAENLPTEVTYVLNMPDGYEAADFGLETTVKYSDALTTVLRPSPATYDDPEFIPVGHQYNCNDNGDVTDDYRRSAFNVINVNNICVDYAEYVLSSAQIIGDDYAPGSDKPTKVTYNLKLSEGYDPADFGLDTVIYFNSAITDVTRPDAASFSDPVFTPLVHNFNCDDDGDVTPEYAELYSTIEVSGICGLRVYYKLDKAVIMSDDLTPASNLPTNVYYSLVMPTGYKAADYGLLENIVYTNASTSIAYPSPVKVTDPVFTHLAHRYTCDWDGDVTDEYRNSEFAELAVPDVCGQKVSYRLLSATVTSADLTPAVGLPTTVVYELVMPVGYDSEDFGLAKLRTYADAKTDVLLPDAATFDIPALKPVEHKYVCGENGDVFAEFNESEYRTIKVSGVCCDSVRYELAKAYVTADDKTPAYGLATELVYNLVMPCGDPEDFALNSTLTISNALTNITKPDAAVAIKPTFKTVTHRLDCDLSTDVTADYLPVYGTIDVDGVCGNKVSYVLKKAFIRGAMSPAAGVPTTLEYELVMPDGYDADDFSLPSSLTYEDATTDIIKPESASFKLPNYTPVDHDFACVVEDGNVTADYLKSAFATIPVSGVCDAEVYYQLANAQVGGSDFTPADELPTTLTYDLVIPSVYSPADYGLDTRIVVDSALTNILKPAPVVFSKPAFEPIAHDFVCDDNGDVTKDYLSSKFTSITVNGICGETATYELVTAVIESSDLTPADSLTTRVSYSLVMPTGYDPDDFGLAEELTFYDALTNIIKPAPATYTVPDFVTVDHQYVCNENGDVIADYQREGYGSFNVSGVCEASVAYVLTSAQVLDEDLTPADNLRTKLTYSLVGIEGHDPSDFGLSTELQFDALTNILKPDAAVFVKPDFKPVDHQYVCNETGDVTAEYLRSEYADIVVSGVCNMSVSYKLVKAQISGDNFLPSDGLATTLVYELTPVTGYDPDDYGLATTITFSDALTNITRPQPAHIELPNFLPVDHKFTCDDDGDVTADYMRDGFGSINVAGICDLDVHYDLVSARLSSPDVTPADGILTKAEYKLVIPDGYRFEDYGLTETISFDTLLTNVTLPDKATFDKPVFTVVDHQYECGDNGDVTADYAATKFAKIDVYGVCGQNAYYELVSAVIGQQDVTPADSLPTTLKYVLVMPDGFDAADFQLLPQISYSDALTNVLKPAPASFVEPQLSEITHTYDCLGDVTSDFVGDKLIPVSGLCDVKDGDVYYEFVSATIIGDDVTPSVDAYLTKVVYQLKGVPAFIDIDDYDLRDEIVFDNVKTTVEPKTVEVECFADTKLTHSFNCSPDVLNDVPSDLVYIDVPQSELCGGLTARYELSSAAIADGESYSVGIERATRLTYKLAGLEDEQQGYYSLSPVLQCEALTDIVAANVGFDEPNIPQRLAHVYNCSPDVKAEFVDAGGGEKVTLDGVCGFEGVDVFYSLKSVEMVSESGEFTPNVSLYKTVVTYVLNNMSGEQANLYSLPVEFSRETYTEVKPASLTIDCPSDLDATISHVYDGGLDITADYNGASTIDVNVCCKPNGAVYYSLSSVTLDEVGGASVGTGKVAQAKFVINGLTTQERDYYTLAEVVTCPTEAEVTPATLSLVADCKIVGRVYNGSKYLAEDIVTPPTFSFKSADGTDQVLPLSSISFVSATMADKNVGGDKEAEVIFELTGDYVRNFRFDGGQTTFTQAVSGISITRLPVQLDGKPTLADKVNDGTVNIPSSIVVLPHITNVQSDDDGSLDEIELTYDEANSRINEFEYEVGVHSATVTLDLSGVDADNYELIPSSWNDLSVNVLPVSLSIRGEFLTTENRIYDAKRRLDIAQISAPELVYSNGNPVDPAVAHIVVTKAEMLTKDAGNAKATTIEYEISNPNFSFADGSNTASYSEMVVDNAQRAVVLTPSEPAFPAEKTYDCSTDIAMRSVPVIDNVQVNEDGLVDDLEYSVLTSSIENPNVGQRAATFEIELNGADKGNYYLATSSWTGIVDVTPAQLRLDTTNVKLDSHVYNCSSDVMSDFADKAGVMTIESGLAPCDAGAYMELVSAKLNSPDAGSRRTTLTFELRGAASENYALSNAQLVKVVDTDVLPAQLLMRADFNLDSIAYTGDTDITEQFEATGQVPEIISGLAPCDESALFRLVSAKLSEATPGDNRDLELVFTLRNANAKNYGLTASDTVFVISTNVTPKPLTLRGEPQLPTHVYDASVDVFSDFFTASIPVVESTGLNDDIYLQLVSATLDNPNVGQRTSALVFALGGSDAWKYTVSGATFNVSTEVTPRPLCMSDDAVVAPRGYDGTSNVPTESVTLPTLSGVLDTDLADVTLVLADATLDDKGIGHRVAKLRFELSGNKAYDYVLVPDTASVATEILDTRKVLFIEGDLVVDERVYDTTVDIADELITMPLLTGFDETDNVNVSLCVEKAFYDKPDAGDRLATVVVKLVGDRADFYKLGDYVLTADALILRKEVSLSGEIQIDSRRNDGTLAVDSSLIHLPNLDGVFEVDVDDVRLCVNSAVLDSASIGLRNVTLDLSLIGSKAHNYELVGAPFFAKMMLKAADRKRGGSIPRYYSLDGRFVGEGKDFVISTPGLYIKVVGRHTERIIVR